MTIRFRLTEFGLPFLLVCHLCEHVDEAYDHKLETDWIQSSISTCLPAMHGHGWGLWTPGCLQRTWMRPMNTWLSATAKSWHAAFWASITWTIAWSMINVNERHVFGLSSCLTATLKHVNDAMTYTVLQGILFHVSLQNNSSSSNNKEKNLLPHEPDAQINLLMKHNKRVFLVVF